MDRRRWPGDLGWVVQRHGALYAREFGYTSAFEAAVAKIAAEVLLRFDPEREKGWIAELDGERVGAGRLVAVGGVAVLRRDGVIVGAIGVSGLLATEDQAIADAVASADRRSSSAAEGDAYRGAGSRYASGSAGRCSMTARVRPRRAARA